MKALFKKLRRQFLSRQSLCSSNELININYRKYTCTVNVCPQILQSFNLKPLKPEVALDGSAAAGHSGDKQTSQSGRAGDLGSAGDQLLHGGHSLHGMDTKARPSVHGPWWRHAKLMLTSGTGRTEINEADQMQSLLSGLLIGSMSIV